MTTTVGMISVEPGRKNVVPGVCRFSIDVRAATVEGFVNLDGTVRGIVQQVADEDGSGSRSSSCPA
jgi:acetylornithine deacetylase/succinyl-diaminopimelate desuccinylase-like protein